MKYSARLRRKSLLEIFGKGKDYLYDAVWMRKSVSYVWYATSFNILMGWLDG